MKNKMNLLNFQIDVVNEALKTYNRKNSFIFQSPTGTGKTFIAAGIINKFIENNEGFTFLHFAPSNGGLHQQNFEKFQSYKKIANFKNYQTHLILNSININRFKKNNIYFFGWDSLIKKTNNLTSNSGERNNFWDILKNSLKDRTKLFIVIDEQHRNKNKKATKEFLDKIKYFYQEYHKDNDFFRLEMSATIDNKKEKFDYKVKYSDAVKEEIVKKSIKINENYLLDEEGIISEEELLIKNAIKKREEIIKAYETKNIRKKGKDPLVLIQITNKNKKTEEKAETNKIIEILSKNNVNKNHIAIWISNEKKLANGDKVTKKDIVNNNDIHILIFKQAIATGWDVPRASIWVKLRNNMDKSFEVQTLGRILRNQFRRYYGVSEIDNSFVYTNNEMIIEELKDFEVPSSISKQTIEKSKLIKTFDKFEITQYQNNIVTDYEEVYKENNELFWEEIFEKEKDIKDIFYEISINDELSIWNYKELEKKTIVMNKQGSRIEEIEDQLVGFEKHDLPLSLFNRYKSFKKLFNKEYVFYIFNKLIEMYSLKNKQKDFIKKAYKYFFINEASFIVIENLIIKIYNSIFDNKIEKTSFSLKQTVEVFDKYLIKENMEEGHFDQNNYYELSLKREEKPYIFDSSLEVEFYKELIKNKMKFKNLLIDYFIYNVVDANDYFYVTYLDETGKIRKYFPDFIISTEKFVLILDTKAIVSTGEFTGTNSELKLNHMNKYIKEEKISLLSNKKIYFGYITKSKIKNKILIYQEKGKSEDFNDFLEKINNPNDDLFKFNHNLGNREIEKLIKEFKIGISQNKNIDKIKKELITKIGSKKVLEIENDFKK